ncbi:MAG: site-specific DNA-methyltransferase [Spirochaetales bacterium]|nr:site-specific DNA-methyltransferase [Spirochaetales bacterium]
MTTTHLIHYEDSRNLPFIADSSVDLVVTSPPYPMIEMWDGIFTKLNSSIGAAISSENGRSAYELMHRELDKVWMETARVLKSGGWACINIGDATRKIGGSFQLYSNHSRIISTFFALGMECLPLILWRKQTNAPNKFMGSGMLPAGAYVTLEHEYILVFRKGGKRVFAAPEEKERRRRSAIFWEERNTWFSDSWELKGARQALDGKSPRNRSGAYPFELAYRLINMYSLQEDTVLDPFLGTGTTSLAAAASGRNSIGVEVDRELQSVIASTIDRAPEISAARTAERFADHKTLVEEREATKGPLKHSNTPHGMKVVTSQETGLVLPAVRSVARQTYERYEIEYAKAEFLTD